MKILWSGCLIVVAALGLGGCRRAAAPASTNNIVHFAVRGKVLSTDAAAGTVMLDAEAIPGFMEAMAMPYKLAQPEVITELHAGDRITAQLRAVKDEGGYHDAQLEQIVVTAQGQPDYKPAVQYHVPKIGDNVPDFKMVNQSGKTIHLAQYRGRVLLLTFIYTRCPLADYCPRMSQNFAAIDETLARDAKLYGATHLLSISFDPDYDTPAVLKKYGAAYAGGEKFGHWEFAAPAKAELPALEQWFDVGVTPGAEGMLMHSLSTMLIGKDGKIAGWYPTNEWQPQDMAQAVKDAAAK